MNGRTPKRRVTRRLKRPDLRSATKPRVALAWTHALLRSVLRKAASNAWTFTVCRYEPHGPLLTVRSNASRWGFGGPLVHDGQVVSVWADEISSANRQQIPGKAGDPASGRMESFSLA